jgi:hypothetical protein
MAYTTIKKPSDYFNTVIYSGNNTTGRGITGVSFAPDFLWLKERTNDVGSHFLVDNVRTQTGTGGGWLQSNATDSATVDTNVITSLDSDGFTVGNDDDTNGSGDTYVGWNWKANGAGSANTDGSISSTVSASATSGFSIVSYTGTGANATVGHGLGAVPKMIIIKELNNATNWIVYHAGVGNGGGLQLNTTITTDTDSTFWNSTTPTSSVFSLGSNGNSNGSSDNYIAYCFADVQGYSKFGSYTGNDSTDGPFVYTGFRPKYVMIKSSTAAQAWYVYDSVRNTYNLTNLILLPNASSVEATASSAVIDIVSNGFKLRGTTAGVNQSGSTYIYMAFAEEPLVGDNPATAR